MRAMTERERRALNDLVTAGEDVAHEISIATHACRKLGAVLRHTQKALRAQTKRSAAPDQR